MNVILETIMDCVKKENVLIISNSIDHLFNFHDILDHVKDGAVYDSRLFSSGNVKMYVREEDCSKYDSCHNIYSLDRLMEVDNNSVICDLELAANIHHNFNYILYIGDFGEDLEIFHRDDVKRDVLGICPGKEGDIGILFKSIPDDMIDTYNSIISGPSSDTPREDIIKYMKVFKMSKLEVPCMYLLTIKSRTLTDMTQIIGYAYSLISDNLTYAIAIFSTISVALIELNNDLSIAMLEMVISNNDEFSTIAKVALAKIKANI